MLNDDGALHFGKGKWGWTKTKLRQTYKQGAKADSNVCRPPRKSWLKNGMEGNEHVLTGLQTSKAVNSCRTRHNVQATQMWAQPGLSNAYMRRPASDQSNACVRDLLRHRETSPANGIVLSTIRRTSLSKCGKSYARLADLKAISPKYMKGVRSSLLPAEICWQCLVALDIFYKMRYTL